MKTITTVCNKQSFQCIMIHETWISWIVKWNRTGRQVQLWAVQRKKVCNTTITEAFFSERGVECMTSMGSENRRKQPSNTRTSSETTIAAGWPDINLTSEADCWFRTNIALFRIPPTARRAVNKRCYDFRSSGWVRNHTELLISK